MSLFFINSGSGTGCGCCGCTQRSSPFVSVTGVTILSGCQTNGTNSAEHYCGNVNQSYNLDTRVPLGGAYFFNNSTCACGSSPNYCQLFLISPLSYSFSTTDYLFQISDSQSNVCYFYALIPKDSSGNMKPGTYANTSQNITSMVVLGTGGSVTIEANPKTEPASSFPTDLIVPSVTLTQFQKGSTNNGLGFTDICCATSTSGGGYAASQNLSSIATTACTSGSTGLVGWQAAAPGGASNTDLITWGANGSLGAPWGQFLLGLPDISSSPLMFYFSPTAIGTYTSLDPNMLPNTIDVTGTMLMEPTKYDTVQSAPIAKIIEPVKPNCKTCSRAKRND